MENRKILITYFSHSGNTREIAEKIAEDLGGDIFEISAADPYLGSYSAVLNRAKKELESGGRPELASDVEDMGKYDVVFVGYPNWWGTAPTAVFAFLERHDLSGKTVVPFCTHGGGGIGRSFVDISRLCPESVVFDGLEVRAGDVDRAQKKVSEWLQRIGIAEKGSK